MDQITKRIFIALLAFVLFPSISKGQEKLDLFILAGQSNAQGWMGDAAYYPEDAKELDDSILFNWTFVDNESSGGEWITMQPQKGRFPEGHFGPEVSFSRELKKAGYHPAIFKYTKGATGLARDWKAPGDGGIYDRMARDLKSAINKLDGQGLEVIVRGFIWIQGETDAGEEQTANNYYQNLKQLINDLRNNVLNEPELKIILGVDEQHKFVKERPVVVKAQQKLAGQDPNIIYTSMWGLPKADATHLTPEGLAAHGNRLFEAFTELADESGRNVPKPDTLSVITYNIWNGFDWGKDSVRRRNLQQWVKIQQPSVVALQELCAYTPEKLQEDAKSWGHNYSVLLKTTGYSVGLTSEFPIHLIEKIREGLHHGALHCQTAGIDFLVVHLHPGSIKRRREEVEILIDKLNQIKEENSEYIVLGDFNSHSLFDDDLYDPDGYFMNRLRKSNAGKGINGNIYLNDLDYSVMTSFLAFPLYDVTRNFTSGITERGSFPGRVLGPVNNETTEQLVSRLERIDYILVSPALKEKCIDARVFNGEENWFLSDHYPVQTKFILNTFQGERKKAANVTLPDKNLKSEDYHNYRNGIRNSLLKFQREKKGRVAFLGGSITYNGGWRDSICNYLQKRFPETEFEFIAAGIPSMGTTPAAFRLERDVLSSGPVDLLFEEAAVNDATNGRSAQEQIRAMEGIVRHLRRENPATDIVIMHFVDPDKMESYRAGKIPEVIQNHEKVAVHYDIPTINLAKEVTDRIDAGEFTWEDDFKNLHPSPFGQEVYFHSMKTFLKKAWSGTVAEDDKIAAYQLPEPIDASNYGNGTLIDIKNVEIKNGWQIIENWKPDDGKGTRTNYVNVPMLIAQNEGSELEFSFHGNAVGIAVATGPDAGIVEYRIDNGDWQKQDLFTRWSMNLHLPWYYTLATDLPDGKHKLRLRISGDKNLQSTGTDCRIRYFYINR